MIAKAGGGEKTLPAAERSGKKRKETKYPLNCMFYFPFINPVFRGPGEKRPGVILRRIPVMSSCNLDFGGEKNLKRKFN